MICYNLECAKEFSAKTHNQKYCSDECCRIATNKRIMEKYYEQKAIKNGSIRKCKKCSGRLSRYNNEDICAFCEKNIKIKDKNKKNILDMINEII
jgi:hypothetical protein